MATTNWKRADIFQNECPHTFNALQHLVMAMVAYQRDRGKKTLFGKDKGLAAYKKFESALKDTLIAMVLDGAVARNIGGKECRETLIDMIAAFAEVFPNWQDAYSFADEYFIKDAQSAEYVIKNMLTH